MFFLTQISVPGFNQSTKSTDLIDLGEVGRPGRSTDVHKSVHVWQTLGRSTVRVDRSESSALCLFGSTGPVDRGCPTVTFLTVGGRPGRSTVSLSGCHISLTASFLMGL